jgi:hypothetical protein
MLTLDKNERYGVQRMVHQVGLKSRPQVSKGPKPIVDLSPVGLTGGLLGHGAQGKLMGTTPLKDH